MKCYLCENKGTTKEHAPAQCFFPEDKRMNLITVPSCALHNTATSLDDEYIRNVITLSKGTNEDAANIFRDKGFKSMQNSAAFSSVMTKNPNWLNFVRDDETTKNLTLQINRFRFDKALKKIDNVVKNGW